MMQRAERTSWSGFFPILMILSGTYFPFLSLAHSFSVSHSLWEEISEIWITPQRIHDLISMCHSDLIGLDTTSEDLRDLKMFIFDSVCLAVIGRDNESLVAERVKALWSKTTSFSPSSWTKRKTHIRSLSWAKTGQMMLLFSYTNLAILEKKNEWIFLVLFYSNR